MRARREAMTADFAAAVEGGAAGRVLQIDLGLYEDWLRQNRSPVRVRACVCVSACVCERGPPPVHEIGRERGSEGAREEGVGGKGGEGGSELEGKTREAGGGGGNDEKGGEW